MKHKRLDIVVGKTWMKAVKRKRAAFELERARIPQDSAQKCVRGENLVFAEGMRISFIWLVVIFVGTSIVQHRTKTGKPLPKIRRLEALDALEEGVGRATEMSKPVVYLPGLGGPGAPELLASSALLTETARITARYHTRLSVLVHASQAYPMIQGVVRGAFAQEGQADMFRQDDIRWFSDHFHGQAAGMIGEIARVQPGAVFMLGDFGFQTLLIAEAARQTGAMTIAGSLGSVAFLVAACDYVLIGEEMYAASAYISKEPKKIATILIQDCVKYIVTGLFIAGVLLTTFGSNEWLVSFLKS